MNDAMNEFQPPQRVRITLNGGDTDTSCRGIDQDSDARERADRLVSIFRTRNDREAIFHILDRLDADDAAYRELRDRVAVLEAWGAASGWPANPEPACRCPSYEVGSGEDIPECTCDRPIANEAPVRLQEDAEPVSEPEGLEVVAYRYRPADTDWLWKVRPDAVPSCFDYDTEALTPHATATARVAELQEEVERLRERNTTLARDLDATNQGGDATLSDKGET